VDRVLRRDHRIDLGIPHVVVDPVEDSAEFVLVDVEDVPEAEGAVAPSGLGGVVGRHGGDEIGVDDPALHQVHATEAVVVAEPLSGQVVLRSPEMGAPQDVLASDSLVAEVVDGVTDPRLGQGRRVLLAQQHRDQAGLPVVAVDHVRSLVRPDHELEGGLREGGEPLDVVPVPVKTIASEEALRRVYLEEIALPAVHVAEPDRAAELFAVPRHPEIVEAHMQAPHIAVAHAPVFGEHDLHGVAPDLELAAQAEHDIAESAGLGHRRALWRDHQDVHLRGRRTGGLVLTHPCAAWARAVQIPSTRLSARGPKSVSAPPVGERHHSSRNVTVTVWRWDPYLFLIWG